MTDLNEAYRLLTFAKRLHDTIDAITWQAKYNVDLPVDQRINEHICRGRHVKPPFHWSINRDWPLRAAECAPCDAWDS